VVANAKRRPRNFLCGGAVSGTHSLWFDPLFALPVSTRTLNTADGGSIRFWLHAGTSASENWLAGDRNARMEVRYVLPDGSNSSITNLFATQYYEWRFVDLEIPAEARLPGVSFWFYPYSPGDGYAGHWAIDDVEIVTASEPSPPTIVREPRDAMVVANDHWSLDLSLTGSGPFLFQWFHNGNPVREIVPKSGLGGIGAPADAGDYYLVVSNSLGLATSRVAKVTIRPEPTLEEALDLNGLSVVAITNSGWATFRWRGVINTNHDGVDALFLSHYDDYAPPALTATVQGPGEIAFWWQSAVQAGFSSRFRFTVDQEERAFVSRSTSWHFVRVLLTEGPHLLRWDADNDELPFSKANAQIWLDEITFTPAAPQAPRIVEALGFLPSGNILFEGRSARAEVWSLGNNLVFQWFKNDQPILDATNHFVSIAAATVSDSGRYSVLVTNALGSTRSPDFELNVVDPNQQALNLGTALDGANLIWTTSSEAPWLVETAFSHDAVSSTRSPTFDGGESSWVQTEVNGPGTLTFWWSASTEVGFDQLALLDNDRPVRYLDGEAPWQFELVPLSGGRHVLRWQYRKDESIGLGRDRVWLDQVNFVLGAASQISLGAALNQPAWTWITDDAAPWLVSTNVHHDGVAAAASGLLARDRTNCLQTQVSGPATLSFWWLFGAGSGDTLSLLIDGQPTVTIGENRSWQKVAVAIPAGSHTVVWKFSRENPNYVNDSQVWLDEVELNPDATAFDFPMGPNFELSVQAPIGRPVILERSVDLLSWTILTTNIANAEGFAPFPLESKTNLPTLFFRARTLSP
jgi:hypothetical protein